MWGAGPPRFLDVNLGLFKVYTRGFMPILLKGCKSEMGCGWGPLYSTYAALLMTRWCSVHCLLRTVAGSRILSDSDMFEACRVHVCLSCILQSGAQKLAPGRKPGMPVWLAVYEEVNIKASLVVVALHQMHEKWAIATRVPVVWCWSGGTSGPKQHCITWGFDPPALRRSGEVLSIVLYITTTVLFTRIRQMAPLPMQPLLKLFRHLFSHTLLTYLLP